jgi:hypothetical protein
MMPVSPIVVADGLDVSLFDSLEAAAAALEGPDVLDGIYVGYDATGQPLEFLASGGPQDYSSPVHVGLSDGPSTPDALKQLLTRYLLHFGEILPPQPSLDLLLARTVARAGYR